MKWTGSIPVNSNESPRSKAAEISPEGVKKFKRFANKDYQEMVDQRCVAQVNEVYPAFTISRRI